MGEVYNEGEDWSWRVGEESPRNGRQVPSVDTPTRNVPTTDRTRELPRSWVSGREVPTRFPLVYPDVDKNVSLPS